MGKRDRRFGLATIVAVIFSMALSLVPIQPPAAEAQAGILPDLETLEPGELHLTRERLDDGQTHYLLRFTNTVANYGGRFEINADIGLGSPIYQNIYNQYVGGTRVSRTRIATDLVYHPTHHHFHLADFASYDLLKKNPSTGSYIQTQFRGSKTSFCIIDTLRVDSGGPANPEYEYCNETFQGLSHDWADYYDWQLPDQWIDLGTSIPANGEYAIQSSVDPKDHLIESDRSNNTAVHYFRIVNGVIDGDPLTPDCFATPSSAQVGQTIQVSCVRLDPGVQVQFRMDSNVGPIVGTATANSELNAVVSFALPIAAQGQHHIFAVPSNGEGPYSAVVNVVPNLALGTNQGVVGATVPVNLTGFGSAETVSVRVNDIEVKQFPTALTGNATGSFVMPAAKNGANSISAVGLSTGATSTKSFTVQPAFSLGNSWVFAGSPISTTLSGFGASEDVKLTLSGPNTLLKTIKVSSQGSSAPGPTTDLTLPIDTTPGAYTIVATGVTSGATSSAQLQVLAPGADTPTATSTASPTTTTTVTPTRTPTGTATALGGWSAGDLARTTTKLNFRQGPGTNYPILLVLNTNTNLLVTGPAQSGAGGVYVPVRYNGQDGWVAAAYITKVGTATSTATPSASVTPSATATASNTPTASSTATASNTPTASATATATSTASNTPTVTKTPTSSSTPTSTSTATATGTATMTGTATSTRTPTSTATASRTASVTPPSGFGNGDVVRVNQVLNLRPSPGTGGTPITTLPAGAELLVTGPGQSASGYFYIPVRYNTLTGWVASDYVTKIGTATSTPTATITRTPNGAATLTPLGGYGNGDIVRVTESLNFRNLPTLNGSTVLAILDPDTQLLVTGTGVTADGFVWVPVRYNGTNGWVVSDFIQKIGVATAVSSVSPTTTRTVTATATSPSGATLTPGPGGFLPGDIVHTRVRVNLRSSPGTTTNNIIAVLIAGTQLKVTGYGQTANGFYWVPVETLGNTTGWIADAYITGGVSPAEVDTATAVIAPSETAVPAETATTVVEVENPRYDDAVLRWLPEIENSSSASGLTTAQIAALVAVMSGGDSSITSSLGAVGLTQVKPEELVAAGIGESNWYDPATNISLGSALLAGMIDSAGSVEGGLAIWFGEGCDDNGACTADYIQSYLTAVANYQAILADPAAAGYALLPPDWVAPVTVPFVGSAPLRFAPLPPTEEPTIAVPPTEEPTIEIPPTEEPTLEIPTDVPTEEPADAPPDDVPAETPAE